MVSLLHGKGGLPGIPRPFERDIFLFDTHVAGTSHVEGIGELAPHLNADDRLRFDFSHTKALSADELTRVQADVKVLPEASKVLSGEASQD